MSSASIVRPQGPLGLDAERNLEEMSRAPLATLPLMECVEAFDRDFTESASDGVIDADELRRLVRKWPVIPRKCARVHRGYGFVDLLIHGDGVDGDWIQRKWKEDQEDQQRLRVVVRNDDEPEPPDSPMAKRAA